MKSTISRPHILVLLFSFLFSIELNAQIKITFPSKDGVTVAADWYLKADSLPVLLLCHQAHFGRGEYIQTALTLSDSGFNCLAIDQRYGDEINGVKNETAFDAERLYKGRSNEDAEQDIIAAIEYLYEKCKKRIIVIGSSYSASLALKTAKENNHVFAVAAFSPGEYFATVDFVAKRIRGLNKPVFITSSKKEAKEVTKLVKDITSMIKVQYIPMAEGDHGSKVLWRINPYNEEILDCVNEFLKQDEA